MKNIHEINFTTPSKCAMSENDPIMETTDFPKDVNELLDQRYGPPGSPERIDFQASSRAFKVGQIIRQKRIESNMTQQQLADRIGTQKSYISKIERGSDMNLSTLFKIFDHGLQNPVRMVFGPVL